MIDIKRKTPRFDVKFTILAKDIEGKGINISQGGFGFLTENKLKEISSIPFDIEVQGFIFSDKIYKIKGTAKILYSRSTRHHRNLYYNGFKFLKLDDLSKENLYDLLEDIRRFQKSENSKLENRTLADFNYYPTDDLFYKTELFYEAINKKEEKYFQMLSYYLNSTSRSVSTFVHRKTK